MKCPFLNQCVSSENMKMYRCYKRICLGEKNYEPHILPDGDHCPIHLFRATTENREKRWKVF